MAGSIMRTEASPRKQKVRFAETLEENFTWSNDSDSVKVHKNAKIVKDNFNDSETISVDQNDNVDDGIDKTLKDIYELRKLLSDLNHDKLGLHIPSTSPSFGDEFYFQPDDICSLQSNSSVCMEFPANNDEVRSNVVTPEVPMSNDSPYKPSLRLMPTNDEAGHVKRALTSQSAASKPLEHSQSMNNIQKEQPSDRSDFSLESTLDITSEHGCNNNLDRNKWHEIENKNVSIKPIINNRLVKSAHSNRLTVPETDTFRTDSGLSNDKKTRYVYSISDDEDSDSDVEKVYIIPLSPGVSPREPKRPLSNLSNKSHLSTRTILKSPNSSVSLIKTASHLNISETQSSSVVSLSSGANPRAAKRPLSNLSIKSHLSARSILKSSNSRVSLSSNSLGVQNSSVVSFSPDISSREIKRPLSNISNKSHLSTRSILKKANSSVSVIENSSHSKSLDRQDSRVSLIRNLSHFKSLDRQNSSISLNRNLSHSKSLDRQNSSISLIGNSSHFNNLDTQNSNVSLNGNSSLSKSLKKQNSSVSLTGISSNAKNLGRQSSSNSLIVNSSNSQSFRRQSSSNSLIGSSLDSTSLGNKNSVDSLVHHSSNITKRQNSCVSINSHLSINQKLKRQNSGISISSRSSVGRKTPPNSNDAFTIEVVPDYIVGNDQQEVLTGIINIKINNTTQTTNDSIQHSSVNPRNEISKPFLPENVNNNKIKSTSVILRNNPNSKSSPFNDRKLLSEPVVPVGATNPQEKRISRENQVSSKRRNLSTSPIPNIKDVHKNNIRNARNRSLSNISRRSENIARERSVSDDPKRLSSATSVRTSTRLQTKPVAVVKPKGNKVAPIPNKTRSGSINNVRQRSRSNLSRLDVDNYSLRKQSPSPRRSSRTRSGSGSRRSPSFDPSNTVRKSRSRSVRSKSGSNKDLKRSTSENAMTTQRQNSQTRTQQRKTRSLSVKKKPALKNSQLKVDSEPRKSKRKFSFSLDLVKNVEDKYKKNDSDSIDSLRQNVFPGMGYPAIVSQFTREPFRRNLDHHFEENILLGDPYAKRPYVQNNNGIYPKAQYNNIYNSSNPPTFPAYPSLYQKKTPNYGYQSLYNTPRTALGAWLFKWNPFRHLFGGPKRLPIHVKPKYPNTVPSTKFFVQDPSDPNKILVAEEVGLVYGDPRKIYEETIKRKESGSVNGGKRKGRSNPFKKNKSPPKFREKANAARSFPFIKQNTPHSPKRINTSKVTKSTKSNIKTTTNPRQKLKPTKRKVRLTLAEIAKRVQKLKDDKKTQFPTTHKFPTLHNVALNAFKNRNIIAKQPLVGAKPGETPKSILRGPPNVLYPTDPTAVRPVHFRPGTIPGVNEIPEHARGSPPALQQFSLPQQQNNLRPGARSADAVHTEKNGDVTARLHSSPTFRQVEQVTNTNPCKRCIKYILLR